MYPGMQRWAGRVAVVTGASSGIGAAVAATLARNGMVVIGCSRHPEKIEELAKELDQAKGKLFAQHCNIRNEDEIVQLFQRVKAEHGGVDVCVSNAGLCIDAPILTGSGKDWQEMLETNVLGPTICTRESVQSMMERKVDDGHIFNINSMSGHRILSSASGHFYAATKFALTALTEGTRHELRGKKSHIRVTQISPGLVETDFHQKMMGPEKAQKLHKSLQLLKPKEVADIVLYTLAAPPHMQIHDVLVRPTEQAT